MYIPDQQYCYIHNNSIFRKTNDVFYIKINKYSTRTKPEKNVSIETAVEGGRVLRAFLGADEPDLPFLGFFGVDMVEYQAVVRYIE